MRNIWCSLILVSIISCGVQQKLNASYKLTAGMSKAEVEAIMGAPVKSDFKEDVEEWHYCKTGMSADEFLALFFHQGQLIEKLNYTVTLSDTNGAFGNCSKFIKMGNYRVPDRLLEIRLK
jgi:outer membrane protein assembly factor BamE (lipoprotein component of BamABCDE complex)